MKKFFLKLVLCAGLFTPFIAGASEVWKEVQTGLPSKNVQVIHPDVYRTYQLDVPTLRMHFSNLPQNENFAEIVTIPMPDGSTRDFRVWETSMMPQDLAAQYPDIRTYSGYAVDDRTVTAKFDFTLYGFHAMVLDGENTAFIDPFDNLNDGFYIGYYKRDLDREFANRMLCGVHSADENGPAGEQMQMGNTGLPKLAQKTVNGYDLRTYRLALACSNQYATAVTSPTAPTKPLVLSKMTTTMNRVNGVYEREFSITMVFTSAQNNLIFTTAAGDPFNAINSNPLSCLTTNQSQCNSIVGFSNYDIGHVFTTGSGGLATLGCVCSFSKAQGTTGSATPTGDGFDIDYVAHEMGHQFGAQHTFNNNTNGSCGGGNAESGSAYEPGSGSTIMAYAGICPPDNVQSRSDAYFHRHSIGQVLTYVNSSGGNCATKTPTSNKLVKYTTISPTSYTIPYLTPFELTSPVVTDSAGDSVILYAWEQHDLGSFGSTFAATTSSGPIFRSITPSKSNTRVFPKIASVLIGNLNTAYEKAPTVARAMKFKCTYRNIRNNKGCVTIPDEVVTVNAVTTGTGAGFKVTSQGTAGVSYLGGSTQTVTWTVLNTDVAPIGASNVDIWMSQNGGTTYQYFVGTFPNNGSASITVPNPATSTTTARFKVKGANNVFFNVNSVNFKVDYNPLVPISYNSASNVLMPVNEVNIFPVPATEVVHMTTTLAADAVVTNVVGQRVWTGRIDGKADIDVASWSKGIYYVKLVDVATGAQTVKQFVIQ
ncbi:MAG: T9SS type A sorting domain-containing protein [Chitinophagaceae bacterium]|nr:T9SS type A sorting domain-containing protein [Chitinophagaceae bacterium]